MTKEQLQDKCRGCLVGGAIGDALGYPVEFVYSFEEIRRKYGDDGITEYDMCYPWLEEGIRHYKALFSDDTQMTLYTAEGLLEAEDSGKQILPAIANAYIVWFGGQVGKKVKIPYDSKLSKIDELNKRRAPGNACISALFSLNEGKEPMNASKGCGGIMVSPLSASTEPLMVGRWKRLHEWQVRWQNLPICIRSAHTLPQHRQLSFSFVSWMRSR